MSFRDLTDSLTRMDRRTIAFVATGVGLLLALVLGAFTNVFDPGPMKYCKVLEKQGLVKDCTPDTRPPPEAKSVTFKVASNGRIGRLAVFRDTESYLRELRSVPKEEDWSLSTNHASTRRNQYIFASKHARYVLSAPEPLDRMDVEGFSKFELEDTQKLISGAKLEERSTREHPIHVDTCARSPLCTMDGKCSIYPSDPSRCVAGFDADCIASTLCAKEDRCTAFGEGNECRH